MSGLQWQQWRWQSHLGTYALAGRGAHRRVAVGLRGWRPPLPPLRWPVPARAHLGCGIVELESQERLQKRRFTVGLACEEAQEQARSRLLTHGALCCVWQCLHVSGRGAFAASSPHPRWPRFLVLEGCMTRQMRLLPPAACYMQRSAAGLPRLLRRCCLPWYGSELK